MSIIHAVICRVGEPAIDAMIDDSLETLQAIVGGCIECIYQTEEDCNSNNIIICNDEGKIKGLTPNRTFHNGVMVSDIIFGDFIIVDTDGENFTGLSDADVSCYKRKYQYAQSPYDIRSEVRASTAYHHMCDILLDNIMTGSASL